MIVLIMGASHTGKTALAQRLLERFGWPYLSADHLKMGLIRSGHTSLTPLSDTDALTELLWPILAEIIKTAIENGQNLIVEGCYIPFDWADSFDAQYLPFIRARCLIMSENYIRTRFDDIRRYANIIENRQCDELTVEALIAENAALLARAKAANAPYELIDDRYAVSTEL